MNKSGLIIFRMSLFIFAFCYLFAQIFLYFGVGLMNRGEAPFLQKTGKFKIGLNLEKMQIEAFSKRSYQKTKGSLYFIFASFDTHFSKLLSSYVLSRFRMFSISYTRSKKVMFRYLLTP